jgi:aspartyl protease family protein
MGTFSANLRVWNPANPEKVEELEVIVDTGAAYSWVSRAKLESMGVRPVRRMQFRTIEGHTIERDLAPVFVATDGFSGGDNVVMAEAGDMEVMGSHTLESLGVTVDPVSKKLVPSVWLALAVVAVARKGRVVTAIDRALAKGGLREPFSNEDFKLHVQALAKEHITHSSGSIAEEMARRRNCLNSSDRISLSEFVANVRAHALA